MAREVDEEECVRVSGDPVEFYRLIGKTMVEGDTSPTAPKAAPAGRR
jgi:hypothetical protein